MRCYVNLGCIRDTNYLSNAVTGVTNVTPVKLRRFSKNNSTILLLERRESKGMLKKVFDHLRLNDSLQLYTCLFALILGGSAIVLFILVDEISPTIKLIGSCLFILALTMVTYMTNFLKINPYYRGVLFTIITVVVSVLFLVLYSKFFPKSTFHSTGPMVILIQYIVAKLILKIAT